MRHARHACLAIMLPILLTASACLGGAHQATVHLSGNIVTVGGPPPGAPRPIAGARFRLVGNGRSLSLRADAHGRFATDVAPGRYRVVITGHAPRSDRGWLPATPAIWTIRPGSAPRLRLVVSIR